MKRLEDRLLEGVRGLGRRKLAVSSNTPFKAAAWWKPPVQFVTAAAGVGRSADLDENKSIGRAVQGRGRSTHQLQHVDSGGTVLPLRDYCAEGWLGTTARRGDMRTVGLDRDRIVAEQLEGGGMGVIRCSYEAVPGGYRLDRKALEPPGGQGPNDGEATSEAGR